MRLFDEDRYRVIPREPTEPPVDLAVMARAIVLRVLRLCGDGRGGKILLACNRVGTLGHVPYPLELASCARCGRALWVDPVTTEVIRDRGYVITTVCLECIR